MFISKVSRLGAQAFKGLSKAPHTIRSNESFFPIVQNDYMEPLTRKLFSTTATASSQGENEETQKISVTFFDKDREQEIKLPCGMSMLEAAHENDIELEGACEGSLACSTCHVIVMAGVVEALDNLVKEFMSAGGDDKKQVYAKIEAEAGNLDGSSSRYGKIYIKIANNCMAKGAEYAKNEIQRLERILSKSISPLKIDEFTLNKNMLYAFAS